MGLYRILPLDLLTVLHYNKSEHYDRNTKKGGRYGSRDY